jgi:hypothetical protein
MASILREFSDAVVNFVSDFLMPYRNHFIVDYANFRPVEEQGRLLPRHKRNDLLHVDASHSRPTRGARILRVFVNIHPDRPRIWNTTVGFAELARRYAWQAGLNSYAKPGLGRLLALRLLAQFVSPMASRTPYDSFMLRFHNFLKENQEFQAECPKFVHSFPAMSTWLVFSDGVAHAVLSGKDALDQTFIIPVEGLVTPEQSPLRILERQCGRSLAGNLVRHAKRRGAA